MKKLITLTLMIWCFQSYAQNVGIGTQNPKNKLHISTTTDPLRLEGLQKYQLGDSAILMASPDSGVVRYVLIKDLINANLIDSLETLTFLSSTDSTIIYIDENGDSTIVNLTDLVDSLETLTFLSSTDSTIIYIDENGDSTIVNLTDLVDSLETLTFLSSTDSTIIYIDENGDSTIVNLTDLVDSLETLTFMSSTDSTIIYIDENGDSTIVNLTDLVDSLETLTFLLTTDTTLIYIDENGDTSSVDLSGIIDSLETLTVLSTTDSTLIYVDENGDSTVIALSDLVDSLETITTLSKSDTAIMYINESGDSSIVLTREVRTTNFVYGPDGVADIADVFTISLDPMNPDKIQLTGTIVVSSTGTSELGTLIPDHRPQVNRHLLAAIISPTNSTVQTGTIVIHTTGLVEYRASLLGSTVPASSRVIINGVYYKN